MIRKIREIWRNIFGARGCDHVWRYDEPTTMCTPGGNLYNYDYCTICGKVVYDRVVREEKV